MEPAPLKSGSAAWLRQAERGSAAAMRLMVFIALSLGRSLSGLLLYPACAYFLIFSPGARRASRQYLSRVLGRTPGIGDSFRHYHTFAVTIHDRIYLLSHRNGELDVTVSLPDEVRSIFRREQGCLALGAHFGSFEIMRAQASMDRVPPVNILMYLENARRILSVQRSLSADFDKRLIPLGRPGSLLRAQECLDRGEMVGILADRALYEEKTLRCDFLGAQAEFPLAPFLLAGLLKAPVILFFGPHRGGRRYDVCLEHFADRITVDSRDREASLLPWVQKFAGRLEHHCRRTPYNWFNFYDFWGPSGT